MKRISLLLALISIGTLVQISVSGCGTVKRLSPLAMLERSMAFHPTDFPAELENAEIPFESADFASSDGTRLHGWFADHPQPIGVALFCHGNAGNISGRGDTLMILNRRHRLAVMTFDYRGYGKSEGKPSEEGILADARAARRWLAQRKGISESDIIIMGRSLGGAVAVDLAAKDGARGLILASTFTSMPDVAGHSYPWLPTSLLMTLRFNSLEKIRDYSGPLLQSHGSHDELIPLEQGQRLFAAAPGAKEFIVIPNGGHNSPQTEEYRHALDRFLAACRDAS